MIKEQEKVALVTGSSSGVGFETALLLSKSGYFTYASMRNLKKSGSIIDLANKDNLSLRAVQLDVKDDTSVNDAISKIVEEKGRIDVLVNNAGYGLLSPIEDATLDQVKELFETNFFGVVRVIKKVLPIMRRQKKGTIVNVSSNVGRVGMPLISAYAATKAALEGLSESIRYELNGFGINIIVIEPGVIKTNFAENSEGAYHTSSLKSPYADLIGRTMKGFGVAMDNRLSS